jgi:thiamine kinase-like enzyme
MEDAGKTTISLFDFLKLDNKIELDRINKFINILCKELVLFLKFLTEKSEITPRTHKKEFENESVWNMINNYVREFCLNQAKLYHLQNELSPYLEFMNKRYKPVSDDKGVFVLGDLWPNSILIDTDKELFWIIDWEMSRFETKTSDIEQLMSNLWLMKQNSNIFNSNSTQTLIHRIQYEYFGNENNDWRTHCGRDASKSFILWILSLLNESHWQITNSLDVITKALKEAEALDLN